MNPFFIWSSNSFACDLCTLFLHVHKNMNGMKYQIDMIHGFFGVKEKTEQLWFNCNILTGDYWVTFFVQIQQNMWYYNVHVSFNIAKWIVSRLLVDCLKVKGRLCAPCCRITLRDCYGNSSLAVGLDVKICSNVVSVIRFSARIVFTHSTCTYMDITTVSNWSQGLLFWLWFISWITGYCLRRWGSVVASLPTKDSAIVGRPWSLLVLLRVAHQDPLAALGLLLVLPS